MNGLSDLESRRGGRELTLSFDPISCDQGTLVSVFIR